ncbi:hypothetical protein HK405_000761, partial [Cladochytrium tenue]
SQKSPAPSPRQIRTRERPSSRRHAAATPSTSTQRPSWPQATPPPLLVEPSQQRRCRRAATACSVHRACRSLTPPAALSRLTAPSPRPPGCRTPLWPVVLT